MIKRTILAMALVASFALTSPPTAWAQAQKPEKAEKAKDPVCNMMVGKDPKLSAKHKGKTYYFCMKADVRGVQEGPGQILEGQGTPPPRVDPGSGQ